MNSIWMFNINNSKDLDLNNNEKYGIFRDSPLNISNWLPRPKTPVQNSNVFDLSSKYNEIYNNNNLYNSSPPSQPLNIGFNNHSIFFS